jgi:fibronectin type 3 domain-containing protein
VAPGAPSSLQATAVSASQINLSWTAASGTVAQYRIERRTGGGAFAVIDSVGGATLSYQDTGLAAATQYTYRVAACNAGGCSAPSNEASATTGQVAPGAPSNLQATAVSASQINLSWTAASGTVAHYRIERRTDGGAFAVIDSVGGATLSYQDTGLAEATQYTYRVVACNAGGCSAPSSEASATTGQVAPGAPSNLQATAVSASQINLSWTAASGTVAQYRIERRTGGGAFAVIDSVGGATLSYQDTGLAAATQYTYRVVACNAGGCSAPSNEASATTASITVPAVPGNVSAQPLSSTEVQVTWTAPGGQLSYLVRMRQGFGGPWNAATEVGGNATSYTQTGLQPGTAYQFQVAACNGAGCSEYSSPASVTTLSSDADDRNAFGAAAAAMAFRGAISRPAGYPTD